MKKVFTFLILFFLGFQAISQVVYVKQDATGANDGSSWANAYTDFSDALANTTGGEIWVASGAYLPGGMAPDEDSRFAIMNNIEILGGFAGTETSVEERDIVANPVIFTGDIAGDDVMDDFDNHKEDNVRHVLYVDSLLTDVIIDGVSVTSGTADAFTDGVDRYFWSGGGLLSYSPVTLLNCTFSQNYGATGAAVHITGDLSFGADIEACVFEKNRALDQGAVQLRGLSGVNIERCSFLENNVNRGALYPSFSFGVTVEDCVFANNLNEVGFGGAMFNWQSLNLVIRHTSFTGNAAQNAGALYNDNREVLPFNSEAVVIEDCTFDGNGASVLEDTGYGGCIYFWKSSFTMRRCDFLNSSANVEGGAIYNGGEKKICIFEDCSFSGSAATFGGAISNSSDSTFTTMNSCTFNGNIAATSGGGIINAFGANLTLADCNFTENNARWGGGIYFQTDSTTASMSNTDFYSNIAENNGGAFTFFAAIDMNIDSCSFIGNQADFGGAISVSESVADGGHITINKSTFSLNLAQTQGGALNINDVDADISNGLFADNFADGVGTGGAISVNASDSSSLAVNIINSTLADNIGALANGIATYTGESEVTSTLTLQNNLFANPDHNYVVEGGTTTVVSNGGNYSNDTSMEGVLTHAQDINGAEIVSIFVDAEDDNYRLATGSPAIDNGVADNAPETDITGAARIGNVDIGAFEYDPALSVHTPVIANDGQLSVFPNPAITTIEVRLDNKWKGDLTLQVFNINGQLVLEQKVAKVTDIYTHTLSLDQLPLGQYEIMFNNGEAAIIAAFLKM